MPKHGEYKDLKVIKRAPKDMLGSALVKPGTVWRGYWDASDNLYGKPINKWKIDYENGFVGWWEDEYFDYEGKESKELFHGEV